MKTFLKIDLSELTYDIANCKMLKSSLDGRVGFVKKIIGDRVILDMGEIGERNFSIRTIQRGFIPIHEYEDLVLDYFFSNFFMDMIYTDFGIHLVTKKINDDLSERFPKLTNHFIFVTLKSFRNRLDKRENI